MSEFRTVYDKKHRPQFDELDLFWPKEISNLFRRVSDHILKNYDLRFAVPTWNNENGWTYRIGKSGVFMFSDITIFDTGFQIDGINVVDHESYDKLLIHINEVYLEMKEDFEQKIKLKNNEQKERTKLRLNREQQEKELLKSRILPDKYNKFHWPEKLNLTMLRKLYMLDAKGIFNEELADDIGLTLFQRCQYGKSDYELMNRKAIRCHHCENIIDATTDFVECSCGYQYSYREYRRSYHKNNMPSGAAAKVFNQFLVDWPKADSYKDKMILIDGLLHEFHISLISGTVHRPVAMNFMDGSRQKIDEIITELSI